MKNLNTIKGLYLTAIHGTEWHFGGVYFYDEIIEKNLNDKLHSILN